MTVGLAWRADGEVRVWLGTGEQPEVIRALRVLESAFSERVSRVHFEWGDDLHARLIAPFAALPKLLRESLDRRLTEVKKTWVEPLVTRRDIQGQPQEAALDALDTTVQECPATLVLGAFGSGKSTMSTSKRSAVRAR